MIKLKNVPFPIMNPQPPGFRPRSIDVDVPVPKKDELLTREQAVELINDRCSSQNHNDRIWLKYTTMYTILEGTADRGRAVVGGVLQTLLVHEEYDLLERCYSFIGYGLWERYEIEDSGNEVRTPNRIFEFTYDFSLPEKDGRFRMIRGVNEKDYLLAGRKMPEDWVRYMLLVSNPFAYKSGIDDGYLDTNQLCGDPVPVSLKSSFPKSHMVKFADDKKLDIMRARRSLAGLLKLAEHNEKHGFNTINFILQYHWSEMAQRDFDYVIRLLPRILREAVGPPDRVITCDRDEVLTGVSIVYDCFRKGDNWGPYDRINYDLLRVRNWKPLCAVLEALDDIYGSCEEVVIGIMDYLLVYLGSFIATENPLIKRVSKDEIVSYINAYMDRCGMDREHIKSNVFLEIIPPANDDFCHTGCFTSYTDEMSGKTFMDSPVMKGFTEVFGKGGTLILNRKWYSFLVDPENEWSTDGACPSRVDPFMIVPDNEDVILKNMKKTLVAADEFAVDKEDLRGGERLMLAKALVALNSEEIISEALKKKLTSVGDLKRVLRYVVQKRFKTTLIPYLVYVTKKGA